MSERTCGNCRWHLRRTSTGVAGECRRYPPTRGQLGWGFASTDATYTCGEWADGSVTPEQERKRELVRQFAVAIVSAQNNNADAQFAPNLTWEMAQQLVDAEPNHA